MERITSPDGTTVSFNKVGKGPALVLVHGAFSDHHTNWEFVKPILQDRFTLYAIARNPAAFAARIGANLRQLIDLMVKGRALPVALLLLIVALPFSVWLLPPPFRLVAAFAAAVASTIGIFLIFHIDDRYLTITVPAALRVLVPGQFDGHPDAFRTALVGTQLNQQAAVGHGKHSFAKTTDSL